LFFRHALFQPQSYHFSTETPKESSTSKLINLQTYQLKNSSTRKLINLKTRQYKAHQLKNSSTQKLKFLT